MRARDEDYGRIAGEARDAGARLAGDAPDDALAEIAGQTARLRKQLDAVVAIDFFGAEGRAAGARAWCRASKRRCKQEGEAVSDSNERRRRRVALAGPRLGDARGRAGRPHRLGLADPPLHRSRARASSSCRARATRPQPGELRFDMFEGEFTHRGDRCTFEVLLGHAGLDDAGARRRSARSSTTST